MLNSELRGSAAGGPRRAVADGGRSGDRGADRRCGGRARRCAARAAGSTRAGRVPSHVGQVRLVGQPHRLPASRPAKSGTRRGRGRCCGRSCRARRRPRPATSRQVDGLPAGARRSFSVPSTSHWARCRAPMQSEGNSSPVRCTSQTSQPSLPARLSSRKIGAAEHQGRRWPSGCRRPRRPPRGPPSRRGTSRRRLPCRPCRSGRP